jgi:hypothetical protein
MIHIKIFETFNDINSLEEFCNESLANLIDAGFYIKITTQKYNPNVFFIKLYKIDKSDYKNWFRWDDVKDDYIPFLEILASKYDISKVVSGNIQKSIILFRYDNNNEIVDLDKVDEYNSTDHIRSISITVDSKFKGY